MEASRLVVSVDGILGIQVTVRVEMVARSDRVGGLRGIEAQQVWLSQQRTVRLDGVQQVSVEMVLRTSEG